MIISDTMRMSTSVFQSLPEIPPSWKIWQVDNAFPDILHNYNNEKVVYPTRYE